MKKSKMLAMALVLMLCVSVLTACGGGGDKNSGSGQPNQPSNENGVGNLEPISVGILGPLSGTEAKYGQAVRNGATLYIDQYNASGGLNGRMINYEIYDEEGDVTKAVTGYNALMDKGVTAIIGSVTSNPTMAVVPDAFADNMPMITASATAAAVTYDADTGKLFSNMFRSCFIDPFQGEKMADFAKDILDASSVAVIFNLGSDYSIGLKDAFIAKAEVLGMEVIALEAFPAGAVDFQSQLTNIAARNPDVLFVPDYYTTIALISEQARNAGVTAILLGADGWDTVLSAMSNPAPVEGSFYCSGYSEEDTSPAIQKFLADYKEKYNEVPNMFAAQGYDAAMILVAALEKAEATGDETGSLAYRQTVISAMKATNMQCITGHVTYDEFNNPIKDAVIIHIDGGEAKFWGKF